MKMLRVFISIITVTSFFAWGVYVNYALGMRQSADAALQLEAVRKSLSNLAKMKPEDATDYYEEELSELKMIVEMYAGTEEALEARFYEGATYNQIRRFEEAIMCFDEVLGEGTEINQHFKARSLYFKAQSLLGLGDVEKAKEVIAELRIIEPGAANAFGKQLSGTLRLGMAAPEFNIADFKGNPIKLSEYKGNIVVLYFWATWNDLCLKSLPEIKKIHKRFKDRGVQFIGISQDDDIDELKGFVGVNQVDWPQVFEGMRWKGTISKMYNVHKIPAVFVLDHKGKICYMGNNNKKISTVLTNLIARSK